MLQNAALKILSKAFLYYFSKISILLLIAAPPLPLKTLVAAINYTVQIGRFRATTRIGNISLS
jgi:hypothetical protein